MYGFTNIGLGVGVIGLGSEFYGMKSFVREKGIRLASLS